MTLAGTRSFTSRGDPLQESSFQDDIEARAETIEDFEELWSDLTTAMEELQYEEDPESRLTTENIAKAYAARLAFPEKVSVTREPFGRTTDLDEHVRTHFRTLFRRHEELRTTLGWDEDDVLDACELVFVDDAVFRFTTTITFEPADEELATVSFNKYPDEASEWMAEWMEKVDIVWSPLRGERALDETVEEYFRELSSSRNRFVDEARQADVFLPITAESVSDVEAMRSNIKRRLRRGSPSAEQVHRYCDSVVEERR